MLAVEKLNKAFGALQVARDISFHIGKGARHAIIGPNGAGKTTLFDLLTGAIKADSGRILFSGEDITRAGMDVRARAGMARSFQQNNLFADMTVSENLLTALVVARGYGCNMWNRFVGSDKLATDVIKSAEKIGLADSLSEPASSLSYGMQRQLEVGLAMAADPKLLLLDEPTAGMSPEETKLMLALVASLPVSLTVVIIEHDMDVVFQIAQQVTVLDDGAVLFEGTPDAVRHSDVVRARYLKRAK